MEGFGAAATIISVCVLVLLIVFLKRRIDIFINFILRGVLSFVAIYFINMAIMQKGFELCISMNLTTFLTTGTLGFPGLILLYLIGLMKFL